MPLWQWEWHARALGELEPTLEGFPAPESAGGAVFASMDVLENEGVHPEEDERLAVRCVPVAEQGSRFCFLLFGAIDLGTLLALRLEVVLSEPTSSRRPQVPEEAWRIAKRRIENIEFSA